MAAKHKDEPAPAAPAVERVRIERDHMHDGQLLSAGTEIEVDAVTAALLRLFGAVAKL